MDPRDLFCPKFKLVIEDPSLAFRHLKEPWTRLHITRLVDHNNCGEASPGIIIFASDLAQKMGKSRIMSIHTNAQDLRNQVRIGYRTPLSRDLVHYRASLLLGRFPIVGIKAVPVVLPLHY